MNDRLTALEVTLNARFNTMASDVNARFDTMASDLTSRFDGLSRDMRVIMVAMMGFLFTAVLTLAGGAITLLVS